MNSRIFLIAFFAFSLLISCQKNRSDFAETAGYSTDKALQEGPTSTQEQETADAPPEIERKLIKTGNISFETDDINKTKTNIYEVTKRFKGYISNESSQKYNTEISYDMTIRVPAEHFDALVASVVEGAKEIDHKNITVSDVTEQYIDVKTRIKTKKELENRYEQLLAKANNVQEIMSIERELGKLRADIEAFEGRLKYLNSQIGYSTLHAHFYQKLDKHFGFFTKLAPAAKNGWENLLWFFIGLVHIWPFIILGVVTIFLLRRFLKRRKT